MDIHHKHRWVFSPMVFSEERQQMIPAAEDYCVQIEAPYIHNGFALCACTMNAHQFAAAKADSRLTILASVHHHHLHKIPERIAAHHAEHGLHAGMSIHEAMEALALLHPAFYPEY